MLKKPAYMEKPSTCKDKEWWWCSTKTGVKFDPGEYHYQLPSKFTGSAKKRGRGDSSQIRGKNIKLKRAMAVFIYHEDDPEEHKHDEESEWR